MKLYGSIDLHATNNVTVLIDEQDVVVFKKCLSNDYASVLEQRSPYQLSIQGLVVESTYNWYWLVDGLLEADYRVHLANTAAIQQYEGLKYTDDRSGARWLARLSPIPLHYKMYIASGSTHCSSPPSQAGHSNANFRKYV